MIVPDACRRYFVVIIFLKLRIKTEILLVDEQHLNPKAVLKLDVEKGQKKKNQIMRLFFFYHLKK